MSLLFCFWCLQAFPVSTHVLESIVFEVIILQVIPTVTFYLAFLTGILSCACFDIFPGDISDVRSSVSSGVLSGIPVVPHQAAVEVSKIGNL